MDEQEFREIVKRIKEVNEVILEFDPAIREAVFSILQDYVIGVASTTKSGTLKKPKSKTKSITNTTSKNRTKPEKKIKPVGDNSGLDRDDFFLKFDHNKPSDNAMLAAAWHYNHYGNTPFSTNEIRLLADEIGLTVPDRLDMTFSNAQHENKSCFSSAGKGQFKPTVHGEKRLKETYGVKKGTTNKTVPTTDSP